MKKQLAALILALLPVVASAGLFGPDDPLFETEYKAFQEVAEKLKPRFTYVSDWEKWGVEHKAETGVTGDEPFSGDCEEYMTAAVVQLLRSKVIAAPVFVPNHVQACGRYWCTDTLHAGAYPRS